jgi:hypothetical protein
MVRLLTYSNLHLNVNPGGYLHRNGGYENPYFHPCLVVEV